MIWVTCGIVHTTEDWKAAKVQLEGELYYEERLSDNLLIATPKVFHYYLNHSCDANALDTSRSGNVTSYIAWRGIDAGQEVTSD